MMDTARVEIRRERPAGLALGWWRWLVVFLAVLLLVPGRLAAQTVASGYQEYFVVGRAQHVWDMMSKVNTGEGGSVFSDGINSVVTATANLERQIIYYDQWEDGYEADIFNPVQPSTLVLGDGDPSNGDACDFTTDPGCSGDILHRGDFVNLASDAGLGAGCTVASVDPGRFTNLCSSVPVNPRCASAGACTDDEIRFDGGDRLVSTGGPVSLIHSQNPMSQYVGGSTEILPREAVQNAFAYSIPVGEDLYGSNGLYEPFKYVDLDIVAYDDGTSVLVTSPGAGSVSFVLNRGQHWTSLGSIDDAAADSALAITVNAGTKIRTSGPISAMLFTGGSGTWATRHFALIPDVLHSTDYVTTADGDDPNEPAGQSTDVMDRPAAVYIFNPHPDRSIDVTLTDATGTATVTVPANSTQPYEVPPRSTVRLFSSQTFWGITAYDYGSPRSDWGHSWLATRYLTRSYTVSFAPGNYHQPPDANYSAVYVAATQNGTRVRVDLDNDDQFDEVDLDGDGAADPGAADPSCAASTPNCLYTVNALSALSIFDPSDFDNTGTRIVSDKPVALAWGQETDITDGTEAAYDTGFTVYPPLFVDPVLEIEKSSDRQTVPISGGTVTYTLTVSTGDFEGGPLSSVQVWDELPPGLTGSDYVAGSTVITYPNLVQDTTDPTATEDPPGSGRWRLQWTLNPDTLDANRTLTVSYQVAVPAAPGSTARALTDEGRASAILNTSRFEPYSDLTVAQTDVDLAVTVNRSTAQVGETLTYTVTVTNNGTTTETNAVVTDPVPAYAVFCDASTSPPGTCSDPTGGAVFDAAQNAVTLPPSSLAPGASATFTFDVLVADGTPVGTVIENPAGYASDQTPYFVSDPATTEVVGVELDAVKSGPTGPLHPRESAAFEVTVSNPSAYTATGIQVVDPIQANAGYVAGSMAWRRNAGSWTAVTDSAGDDEGEYDTSTTPPQLVLSVPDIPPGEDITFRFRLQVDSASGGLYVNNQATVTSDQTVAQATNLVQIPVVGDADVTGRVFLDLDGDGVQGAGEPGLANVDVIVTDADGNVQTVTTGASGDYIVTVPAGSTTLDVDETDPDFPSGAARTAGTDPQNVSAVAGSTVAASPVGYQPPAMEAEKSSSSSGSGVYPGGTVHYTVTATNLSATTQTGLTVTDPVPAGMSVVPGSTSVTSTEPVFRVTEYAIPATAFTGTTYTLDLNQDLSSNYFVIVQGADGDGTDTGTTGPDENYAALTADPFGTGDLALSGAANRVELTRHGSVNGWQGVVTVVECLRDCAARGFVLRDVLRVAHSGSSTSGSATTANPWTDISQVMLLGGYNGAGCDTPETASANTKTCHARIWPSGSDTVMWSRDATGATLSDATSTVMVLEWGSEWTVQRVRVQGTAGGDGVDGVAEYNTATIDPVERAHTWVWGTGHTDDNGLGDSGEGVVITLGDGVDRNVTESSVAVATEYGGTAIDFEVYALSHPDLETDHVFKPDGDRAALTVDVTTRRAAPQRMALSYNTCNGTGTAYPRPMFFARYLDAATIRLERRRYNQPFAAWVQGIDFSAIGSPVTFAGGDPPDLITAADGVSLEPKMRLTVTYDLVVDSDLAGGVASLTNTATVASDQNGPYTASVTDPVVRPAVQVEPNNGNYVVYDAGAAQTRTYFHSVGNTGDVTDSYAITAWSQQGAQNPGTGWKVELIDPETGAVIATDTDFTDATWDGGLEVHTGSLAPGASVSYQLRVTVPAGTPAGTDETTTLTATSDGYPGVEDGATDDTTVADGTGSVVLVSDQSGIVLPGGDVVYPHWLFNRTGARDVFDLVADTTHTGWSATIYNDSNGDGTYTPGVDVQIANTAPLDAGANQLFFVRVTAPAGASPGDTDVTHVTAESRADASRWDGVTDTTTVQPASALDLSGGGSLTVSPGDDCGAGNGCPAFPGTLTNLGTANDTYEFTVSASPFHGLDGLAHATGLWIDTDGDGVADTRIASDTDGDGTWDFIAAGYDGDGDGLPDLSLAAGGTLHYELRRPVSASQGAARDPVTLTATSASTGEQDSVTATDIVLAPTYAALRRFSAVRSGSTVVLSWETMEEIGAAGFVVERIGPGGRRTPVRDGLVPALGDAPTGGTYTLVDPSPPGTGRVSYVLREVTASGRTRILATAMPSTGKGEGPVTAPPDGFSVTGRDPVLPREKAPHNVPSPTTGSGDRLRLSVRETGLHFVPAERIAALMGRDTETVRGWIARGEIQLSRGSAEPTPSGRLQGGRPDPLGAVAWLPAAEASGLYFHARAVDSIYTDRAVYWLEHGEGIVMEARGDTGVASGPATAGEAAFTDHRSYEEDGPYPLTSVIHDPDADFWFWDAVLVNRKFGIERDTMTVTLHVPAPAAQGEAVLEVYLQAETTDEEVPLEHHAVIELNGARVASARWDGATATTIRAKLDAKLLRDGANQLVVRAPADTGLDAEIFYLDRVGLTYPHRYVAEGSRAVVHAEGRSQLTVTGFDRGGLTVFDITDPDRPAVVPAHETSGPRRTVSVSFPTAGGETFLIQPLDLAEPAGMEADRPSQLKWTGNRADYLIIAGPGLEDAAEELARYRSTTGFSVMVVRIQDVYDEFSGGEVNPLAVRELLRYAASRWAKAPGYVVLVGDSSFDYKDILGYGGALIPSPMVDTPEGLFPSDHRLADLQGNDGVPEVAIGRIPARTPDQVRAYVDKIRRMERGGAWSHRALWLADRSDAGGEFGRDAEALSDGVPSDVLLRRVYVDTLGYPEARRRLLAGLGRGAALVHYLGHANMQQLGNGPGLLAASDVAHLGNTAAQPVLAAFTCTLGRFDRVVFDTLGEALLLQPDGGAAAVWAPTGLSYTPEGELLSVPFTGAVFGGARVGDAVRTALEAYVRRTPGRPYPWLPALYTLLGDPALRVVH